MKDKLKIYLLTLVTIGLFLAFWTGFSLAMEKEERFIYDPLGKRDPFLPLLDEKSPTGLRTNFNPPEIEVRLPVEIKVSGIVYNGREYFAVINGEVMKKGHNLGEVKIKDIQKDKVVLEYGEREFTVILKKEKEK